MPRSPRVGDSLAWLFNVLFSRTWAEAGMLPRGLEHGGRYAVLPSGRGRSFVIPPVSRTGASAALTAYNALRPGRTRLNE